MGRGSAGEAPARAARSVPGAHPAPPGPGPRPRRFRRAACSTRPPQSASARPSHTTAFACMQHSMFSACTPAKQAGHTPQPAAHPPVQKHRSGASAQSSARQGAAPACMPVHRSNKNERIAIPAPGPGRGRPACACAWLRCPPSWVSVKGHAGSLRLKGVGRDPLAPLLGIHRVTSSNPAGGKSCVGL